MVVAGGLTAFVFGVYFYTVRAVGGTDELQMSIDKFEDSRPTPRFHRRPDPHHLPPA